MVSVAAKGLRDDPFELRFYLVDGPARRQAGPVAHTEDMCVDGKSFFAESCVEDNIGGLASDSGQCLKLFAGARNLAPVPFDQRLAQRDDVLGLGIEQADRLDCLAKPFLAQVDHVLRGFDPREKRPHRNVDADVGRLRRENHRHEQLIGVFGFELSCRRRVRFCETAEELENLVSLHRPPG